VGFGLAPGIGRRLSPFLAVGGITGSAGRGSKGKPGGVSAGAFQGVFAFLVQSAECLGDTKPGFQVGSVGS
jgi:hypothetical protein